MNKLQSDFFLNALLPSQMQAIHGGLSEEEEENDGIEIIIDP